MFWDYIPGVIPGIVPTPRLYRCAGKRLDFRGLALYLVSQCSNRES